MQSSGDSGDDHVKRPLPLPSHYCGVPSSGDSSAEAAREARAMKLHPEIKMFRAWQREIVKHEILEKLVAENPSPPQVLTVKSSNNTFTCYQRSNFEKLTIILLIHVL